MKIISKTSIFRWGQPHPQLWTFFVRKNEKPKYFRHRYLSACEHAVIRFSSHARRSSSRIQFMQLPPWEYQEPLAPRIQPRILRHLPRYLSIMSPFLRFSEGASAALHASGDTNKSDIRNTLIRFLADLSESLLSAPGFMFFDIQCWKPLVLALLSVQSTHGIWQSSWHD